MEIRQEHPSDIKAIHQLTTDAFAPMNFSDGTEPDIPDRLRASGELTLSLVAIVEDAVVGHAAFSPVKAGSVTSGWYGLGPISVTPSLQRTGIGSALIYEGFKRLKALDALGCALTGNPAYYSRFGFVSDGNLHYGSVPDSHVQWIAFGEDKPQGELIFSAAFGD